MRIKSIGLGPKVDTVELYPLSDLHWEDSHADRGMIKAWREWILAEPNRFWYGGGDLFDVATRESVTGVFGQVCTLDEAVEQAVAFLEPVKDRCWGILTGNHERRIHKYAGFDPARMCALALGVAHDPDAFLFYLRHGKRRTGIKRQHATSRPQFWSIYTMHGWGGGRTIGAKANKLDEIARTIEGVDLFIMSHHHEKISYKRDIRVPDPRNGTFRTRERTFVGTSAMLNYGGYAERYGFSLGSKGSPLIRFTDHPRTIKVEL